MRALSVEAPWGLDRLRMVEVAVPDPGPGEVQVRMRAASLNYRDLMMVQGQYMRDPKGAITPLSDGCGIVETVGEGVTRVAVGDRVAPMFNQLWLAGPPLASHGAGLGFPLPGVGRDLAVFSQEGVSRVPDFLNDGQVASLPCAALTAWNALFHGAPLQPGDTVVLQGTGGVSIFGLQFAHAAGLRTIITSSSDEKLARAKALGADHLINYRTTPQWSQGVREATGGRGADLVLEVGGGQTMLETLKSLRVGGQVSIIGVLGGPEANFSPAMLLGTHATLRTIGVGSREMFEAMCRGVEQHQIQPVVDRTYPFDAYLDALKAMQANQHFGKIVLEF